MNKSKIFFLIFIYNISSSSSKWSFERILNYLKGKDNDKEKVKEKVKEIENAIAILQNLTLDSSIKESLNQAGEKTLSTAGTIELEELYQKTQTKEFQKKTIETQATALTHILDIARFLKFQTQGISKTIMKKCKEIDSIITQKLETLYPSTKDRPAYISLYLEHYNESIFSTLLRKS